MHKKEIQLLIYTFKKTSGNQKDATIITITQFVPNKLLKIFKNDYT